MILLRDNARPHVARIKKELLELECEVLPHHPLFSRLGPIGLLSFPINATRARRYTLLQLRRSPKMRRSMDCFKKQVILSSRNPTFAKKMGKSHKNNGLYFD